MTYEQSAYVAGLIDGEGCITCKQYLEHRKGKPRAYLYWRIIIEVAMTCDETIDFLHKMVGCGTVTRRPKMAHQTMDQYRWRCTHRDALKIAKEIAPYSITKRKKLENIIKHYNEKDR